MAWYTEGQVTIVKGATSVTGINTKFASNARVGDAFRGPDGLWYEVVNVASETTLGIFPAYQGANVTASAVYTIAPMQGYVKESADRLRALTNQYGVTLGLLGSPTNVTQLRTNIGAAKSGANSDITALAGLTTALSIGQGGTGAKTIADARTNLGIKTGGLLDATSAQASGGGSLSIPGTSVCRVAEAVHAAHQYYGFYISGSGDNLNIDTLPNGWCGLVSTSNVTGSTPSFGSSGFFWLMTQATYTGQSGYQMAVRYGGGATSGTNLSPTMAIRIRNTAGTAWGPWGNLLTTEDVVANNQDATAGKIVNVGYMGLGSTVCPSVLDMNGTTAMQNGFSWVTSGTANSPTGYASGSAFISVSASSSEGFQILSARNLSGRFAVRRRVSNNWGQWVEPVLPGDFGLGGNTNTELDCNLIRKGGFYAIPTTAGGGLNGPEQIPSVGWFVNCTWNGESGFQIASPQTSVSTNKGRLFSRQCFGAGNWSPWVEIMTTGRMTGSVSGNYANPTGAIIERGGNANGEYTKFADGTMICWMKRGDTDTPCDVGMLGAFRSPATRWTFPMAFSSAPVCTLNPRVATALGGFVNPTTGYADYYYLTNISSSATTRNSDIIAIGRWV